MNQTQQINSKSMQISQQSSNCIEETNIKGKSKRILNPYIKWTREQDVLYIRFLKSNVQRMKKTYFRKPYNKFKKMAQFVNSKDSFQCRSHHQKMIKKFGSIQGIIQNVTIITSKMSKKGQNTMQTIVYSQNQENSDKMYKSIIQQQQQEILDKQIKIKNLQVEIKAQKNKTTYNSTKISLKDYILNELHNQTQLKEENKLPQKNNSITFVNHQRNQIFNLKKIEQNNNINHQPQTAQNLIFNDLNGQMKSNMNYFTLPIINDQFSLKNSNVIKNSFDAIFAMHFYKIIQMNEYFNTIRSKISNYQKSFTNTFKATQFNNLQNTRQNKRQSHSTI